MKSFESKAWLLPQPVLVIGTYDEQGEPNAMNAAWAGQWDMKEIMISMGRHATTRNIDATGEFTVAFATADTMIAADYVGIVSAQQHPHKINATGWTCEKGESVYAPVFIDFPMTLECRLKRKLDESDSGYVIVAEIVNILVDEAYIGIDGKPDVELMKLITFDPVNNAYLGIGPKVGDAFKVGKVLMPS
ncbi:MAG: flavin reductase family protein [Candidatus Amulumruptor caecigallinarius]|nr:flavin reductase family protein [Candidatus Amulumruptor caecigallinarius]